jgi:antitoxin component HigA of HigAB toxin-antitoxin module
MPTPSENLKQLMLDRGEKQKDITGVPQPYVSMVLSGKRRPGRHIAFALAEHFKVPVTVFLEPPPPLPKRPRKKISSNN